MKLKHELRKGVRSEIAGLPDKYIHESDEGIFKNIMTLPEFLEAQNVMLYYSMDREPGTHRLAEYALANGKTVAFPYCYIGGVMEARVVQKLSDLTPQMLGIPAPSKSAMLIEPCDIDMIVVPALTYDKGGYRLGYGGGYYDRYLAGISAFTAGLARERLVKDSLPREAHDIAVHCLVTEDACVRMRNCEGTLLR